MDHDHLVIGEIGRLTFELVKLRQNECKHLCIENVGPTIFGRLLRELDAPEVVTRFADSCGCVTECQPENLQPGERCMRSSNTPSEKP